MKILWIVNTNLGPTGEILNGKRQSGAWMDAMLQELKDFSELELSVAVTGKVKDTIAVQENGVVYYILPDNVPILYNENKTQNILAWRNLLNSLKPDLIQVFGNEFTHGLCALREANNIPSVVYIQGFLGSIARHYRAGIPYEKLIRTVTFRDIIKRDSIIQQQRKYYIGAVKEREALNLAGRIICENDWCENSIRSVAPKVRSFRCPLSVNEVFSKKKWEIDKAEPHSIICTASGYTIKGLHMLLRAVALLRSEYSDIKLYIPGSKVVSKNGIISSLRKRGYSKYIEQLILELNIEENIIWLGALSQSELAEQYVKSRVFVMCSAIENHSSSLKEAMIVGTPSVSAAVGGIPEYVCHGENGLLYRFEEYEILAAYIRRLFEDDGLCRMLSENGRRDMLTLHSGSNIGTRMMEIYRTILSEE